MYTMLASMPRNPIAFASQMLDLKDLISFPGLYFLFSKVSLCVSVCMCVNVNMRMLSVYGSHGGWKKIPLVAGLWIQAVLRHCQLPFVGPERATNAVK